MRLNEGGMEERVDLSETGMKTHNQQLRNLNSKNSMEEAAHHSINSHSIPLIELFDFSL